MSRSASPRSRRSEPRHYEEADEAVARMKRNPGTLIPHFAALHAGYGLIVAVAQIIAALRHLHHVCFKNAHEIGRVKLYF